MKALSKIYNTIIFTFLYAPIVVLIIYSFNDSKNRVQWGGFTLNWYRDLFSNELILESLMVTLQIAVLAALISTVIGTMAAVGIFNMNGRLRRAMESLNNIPMVNPEIVTGISLMLLFVFVSNRIFGSEDVSLGFGTLLIAHTTFNLPYVILSVAPKIRQIDKFLPEAAQDLGCTPLASFFKVELPCILPGVVSGFIMAFTLSLDDFVISLFNGGDVFKTLPVLIYNYTKKPVKPDIYALFTILVLVILCLLMLSNAIASKDERKEKKKK